MKVLTIAMFIVVVSAISVEEGDIHIDDLLEPIPSDGNDYQSPVIPNIKDCPVRDRVTYTAAVLEFEPYSKWTAEDTGESILMRNVDSITEYAILAQQAGADLFVVPEYSVQGLNMYYPEDLDRTMNLTQAVPSPDEHAIPCSNSTTVPYNLMVVHRLSCLARNLSMYLVVDLAEQVVTPNQNSSGPAEKDPLLHNTQVVFDREGRIIARYRKENLFMEDQFTPGPNNDSIATFQTDFGVTFALQICFDLVYEHPAYSNIKNKGLRDVVMSTAWVDELPFAPAITVQNGWSRALGANLLVAGYHWPERAKLGSGIFKGYSDLTNVVSYDPDSGNELIVSLVETCRTTEVRRVSSRSVIDEPTVIGFSKNDDNIKKGRHHNVLHENLSSYNKTVLHPTATGEIKSETLCHNDGFCCSINYEHSQSNLTYSMLVKSGVFRVGNSTLDIYIQNCGIVWCFSDSSLTCARIDIGRPSTDIFGPFTLEATFSAPVVYASIMTRNWTLVPNDKYSIEIKNNTQIMSVQEPLHDFLGGALYGRWFEKDLPHFE